jgi:hypothetical protein
MCCEGGLLRMVKKLIVYLLAFAAGMLLLAACAPADGVQTDQKTAPPDTIPVTAPASAEKSPQTSVATPSAETKVTIIQTIEVHNAKEFFRAIKPNAVIHLLPGDYDLRALQSMAATDHVYYDQGPVIQNIANLKIYADKNVAMHVGNDSTRVINLVNCSGVSFTRITFGHAAKPGVYSDSIVSLTDCKNIGMNDCELYGSGKTGLLMLGSSSVNIRNSVIRDCAAQAFNVSGCCGIVFGNVKIFGMGDTKETAGASLMSVCQSTSVRLRQCTIYGNGYAQDTDENYVIEIDEAAALQVSLEDCTIAGTNKKYEALCNGPLVMKQNGESLVHNARELFCAIRPNAVIRVLAGDYNMECASMAVPGYIGYENGARVTGVSNLKIYSLKNVLLYSGKANDSVLAFENCQNITMEGLTMGHSMDAGVMSFAPVIYAVRSAHVNFHNCDLYGCGIEAYQLENCNHIQVNGGCLHNCYYSAFSLYQCNTVNFTGVEIRNNGNQYACSSLADIGHCTTVLLSGCNIHDNGIAGNENPIFTVYDSRGFSYTDSTFKNNTYKTKKQ